MSAFKVAEKLACVIVMLVGNLTKTGILIVLRPDGGAVIAVLQRASDACWTWQVFDPLTADDDY
jgi:hypothetical protein